MTRLALFGLVLLLIAWVGLCVYLYRESGKAAKRTENKRDKR